MGVLLNPDYDEFQEALDSKIYVDKSMLMKYTNDILRTNEKYICVSRPRRFGKSMTANMLVAYYSKGCNSRELFSDLKIAKCDSFEKHLNQYNVIHIDMSRFSSPNKKMGELLDRLSQKLIKELKLDFGDIDCFDWNDLFFVLEDIFAEKKIPFIFIIDEWDCYFREHQNDKESQKIYLDFLRKLLKDQSYVALAYMTGILPIKKYGVHSALNMFTEVSMTNAREYAEFTGFTEAEVLELCKRYDMLYERVKYCYDGYNMKGISIYNPRSVVMSMTGHDYDSYWTSTETFDALKVYIYMNIDNLREKVVRMIAGERVPVNTGKFQNDMTTLNSSDDVLTLLVHLGYLTYNPTSDMRIGEVWIPNAEIQQEFINSIEDKGWEEIMKSINASKELIEATLACDEEKVAQMIEKSHQDNSSILKYNDENSLACVISLAYYSMREKYVMHRELPTGKGFADIVYLPKYNMALPAIVVELKHNKSAETAIEQIKNMNYTDKLAEYSGEIILVGISYNDDKGHSCKIDKLVK